jgi:uncharacterized zinc-type alcohol dehydrogenase-like protein
MRQVQGFASLEPGTPLQPWRFTRRDLRADDVAIEVTYCGVCHSDLHAIDAGGPRPLVPGHEFVGRVGAVGSEVSRFAVGDLVAVGNIVDSCGTCRACRAGQENYCEAFPTTTYGGVDRVDGTPTQGAYASEYVARDKFVHHLPPELDPAGVAPLMCAGVTVWEPLRRWAVGPGKDVGIVGLGGLGHLAVKLAKALGARVTVFTTSPGKEEAARALGVDDVVLSRDEAAMAAVAGRYDVILDTASAAHDPAPYLRALAMDGTLCVLGIPEDGWHVDAMSLLVGRKSLASAGSGGLRSAQELLDFAAEHRVTADVEVLPADQVEIAVKRLRANDVRYRFVLDMTGWAPVPPRD